MDSDWCLYCGKKTEGDNAYCSFECQHHDNAGVRSSQCYRNTGAVSDAKRARQGLAGIRAWAEENPQENQSYGGSANPDIQASINRSSSVTFKGNHDATHRAPNLIRPSRPVSPFLTTSLPERPASAPLQSSLSSQGLLATISRARPSGAATRISPSASWPTNYPSSSALSIVRRNNRIDSLPSAMLSGTSEHNLPHRRAALQMGSPTSTQSSSATLVDHGLRVPGISLTGTSIRSFASESPGEAVWKVQPPRPDLGGYSPRSGFFDQSHHFVVSNSAMYSIGTQHSHYYGQVNVLERLAQYVMPGAGFDSRLREYPPRCHPGTRNDIMTSIRTSLHSTGSQTRLIWISGPAGAGKSAILQTLVESESRNIPCASLFFSRKEGVNDIRRVLPTIAYQLAVRNDLYSAFIEEQFRTDPIFLERSLTTQFQDLVVIPFAQKRISLGSERCAVFMDALEECQNERDQVKILELIYNLVLDHPNVPITWIFATRPEHHLRTVFSRAKAKSTSYREYHLSISSKQARQDVKHFLQDEFRRIKDSFPEAISPSSPWPTLEQFCKITSTSSGFFAFAFAVVRFIDKPTCDPLTRLHCVLAFLDGAESRACTLPTENPFTSLDLLYSQNMSAVPRDLLAKVKSLLGYYMSSTIPSASKKSLLLACNILGFEHHVESALRALSPVLTLPPPFKVHIEGLRFLHFSFIDYLRDPKRSDAYWIDMNVTLTELWQSYTRIVLQWLESRSTNSIRLSWTHDSDGKLGTGYDVRGEMFRQASSLWTVLLEQYCHRWCLSSCPIKFRTPFLLSPTWTELHDILHQMDFESPLIFGENPINMLNFFMWIKEHTPIELRNKLILQDLQFMRLDRPRFFKALCAKKWYRGITERNQDFDVEIDGKGMDRIKDLGALEWIEAEMLLTSADGKLGDLVRLLQGGCPAAEAMATIIGTDQANCCGLIRYQASPSITYYHIFPYSEIDSSTCLSICSLD